MPTRQPKKLGDMLRDLDMKMRQEMVNAVNVPLATLLPLHRQAVNNWENKPKFDRKFLNEGDTLRGQITVAEGHAADLWFWTDEGTRAHEIRAKNVPLLRFQLGHQPKTRAIAKANVGSGKSTGAHVAKVAVNHPGTEARKFRHTWIQQVRTPFINSAKNIARRATAK